MAVLLLSLVNSDGAGLGPASAAGDRKSPHIGRGGRCCLQDNRQVKNAALEVSKSGHLLAAVRTRRLPNFEVIVAGDWLLNPPPNFNALGGAPGVLPIPIPITSAPNLVSNRQPTALMTGFMAQPLSQQYRIGLNISMHGVMRDITREQLRAKRQDVVNDVGNEPTSIFSRPKAP